MVSQSHALSPLGNKINSHKAYKSYISYKEQNKLALGIYAS